LRGNVPEGGGGGEQRWIENEEEGARRDKENNTRQGKGNGKGNGKIAEQLPSHFGPIDFSHKALNCDSKSVLNWSEIWF
jgi:hypothetical protein